MVAIMMILDEMLVCFLFSSASVQCLRKTSELSQQTQTDMITRVFWIAVSLFESDYDHEYLMAIELVNQVKGHYQIKRI